MAPVEGKTGEVDEMRNRVLEGEVHREMTPLFDCDTFALYNVNPQAVPF